jgi:hypothetical protein
LRIGDVAVQNCGSQFLRARRNSQETNHPKNKQYHSYMAGTPRKSHAHTPPKEL